MIFCSALLIFTQLCSNAQAVLVDLSHVLDENARNWPITGFKKYKLSTLIELDDGGKFTTSKDIEMTEHTGTHMDAPHHFGKTSWDLSKIPIENFVVPLVKIDVRDQCAADPDYALSVEDLLEWEEKHGKVPAGAVVVMQTGWGAKYGDAVAYYGTERNMDAEDFDYDAWSAEIHFPGFSYELAVYLLENHNITGVGVDTASIDPGNAAMFPVHFSLQEANKYGIENLCCLEDVPENGGTLMAIPPKVSGGSGFTIRPLVDTDSSFAYKRNAGSHLRRSSMLIFGLFVTAQQLRVF